MPPQLPAFLRVSHALAVALRDSLAIVRRFRGFLRLHFHLDAL